MRNLVNFVVVIVVVVVSSVLGACTQEEVVNTLSKSTVPDTVVTGRRVINTLQHDVVESGDKATDNMTATATIEDLKDGNVDYTRDVTANPKMNAAIFCVKDNYTITESEINCSVVSTNILRNQKVNNLSDGMGKEVTDTVVITISDGQIVKLPSTITSFKGYDGSNYFDFGTLELKDAKCVSIENSDRSMTRSTYVKQTLNTRYTVDLFYSEKNTNKDTTIVVRLMTMATRRVIANDEIDTVKVENKNRVVIDENTEKVSFDEVIVMKSGETVSNSKSMILNREFKGIDAYEKIVKSFAFNLANVNGIVNGTDKEIKNVDGWTVYGKTDKYSANISNGVAADAFATAYTLYHERASYKDSNVEVVFDYEDVKVSEAKNEVVFATTDKSGYDKNIYNNEIATSYIGYTQNIAEEVYLYKMARAISGYDFRDAQLVINNNNVVASLIFVTKYNDGTETSENVSKTFARSLTCTSNWKAYENSSKQFTHMLNVKLAGTDKKNDGAWSWNEETRNITNFADLEASTQTNSWVSVDPNAITYTRNGQTYKFDVVEFGANDKDGEVTLTSETEEAVVYNYAATVTVSFGNNTVSSVAPGMITVAKPWTPDFPAEWGKFVAATSTVACNENTTDWVYTWSLHFENGTLPVVVGKNSADATIDQSLFEYDTNAKLNGAAFVKGRWINAIASDTQYYMLWCNTNGVAQNSMIYETATMWKWNNGKNSVFTSDFSFSVENDGKVLKVKKNGADFATYKAAK